MQNSSPQSAKGTSSLNTSSATSNWPALWCHGKEFIFRDLLRRLLSDHWNSEKTPPLRADASDQDVFCLIWDRARLTAREFLAQYQSFIWKDPRLTKKQYKKVKGSITHYARQIELVEEGGSIPSADVLWQEFRNSAVEGVDRGKIRGQSCPGRMECVWAEEGSP